MKRWLVTLVTFAFFGGLFNFGGVVIAAEGYPSQTVRIIVPYSAGGGTDTIARIIAEGLSEKWESPVIVENRTGAGGQVGTDVVARADADGHTLLMTVNAHAINASLYDDLPYHPTEDFVAVINAASSPNIVAVNPEVPVSSVDELIEYARANPGELAFGHGGVGVPSHLAGELLNAMAGIDLIEVAYGGIGPAIAGTLGGEVHVVFAAASGGLLDYIEAGDLRALAVTTKERYESLPDLPTVEEAGLDGYDVFAWFGMLAPAGTPRAVVEKINQDAAEVLRDGQNVERIGHLGAVVDAGSADEFQAYIEEEWAFWDALIDEVGISVDR